MDNFFPTSLPIKRDVVKFTRSLLNESKNSLMSSSLIVSCEILTFFAFFFLNTYGSSIKPSWEGLGSKISTIRWRKNTSGVYFSVQLMTEIIKTYLYIHSSSNLFTKTFFYPFNCTHVLLSDGARCITWRDTETCVTCAVRMRSSNKQQCP